MKCLGKYRMKNLFALASVGLCLNAFTISDTLAKDVKQTTSVDFSTQWGLDAINIPHNIDSSSAESLGLLTPKSYRGFSFDESSYSQKFKSSGNDISYVITSSNSTDKTSINFSYNKGNFTASSGLETSSNNLLTSQNMYLQGSYSVFKHQNFNVSLTAKIEALDKKAVNDYFQNNDLSSPSSILNQQATNTTLGIVSTYSITDNWKILGMISTTSLDDKIERSPLIKTNNIHQAQIGTSYSF